MEPHYWNEACSALETADPVLAGLIREHRRDVLRGSGNPLQTILNAIVGQQISVAAAESIWKRLLAVLPEVSVSALASMDPETLRAVGLSWRKVEYVQEICRSFQDGTVQPERWPTMSDLQIRSELCSIRGVGPWTADMVLIFHLQRPDVLPLEDIGLINAAFNLYGWDDPGSPKARRQTVADHARLWTPWRTVATWYIWRDLDADPVIY